MRKKIETDFNFATVCILIEYYLKKYDNFLGLMGTMGADNEPAYIELDFDGEIPTEVEAEVLDLASSYSMQVDGSNLAISLGELWNESFTLTPPQSGLKCFRVVVCLDENENWLLQSQECDSQEGYKALTGPEKVIAVLVDVEIEPNGKTTVNFDLNDPYLGSDNF